MHMDDLTDAEVSLVMDDRHRRRVIEAMVRAAVAAEREACAQVADGSLFEHQFQIEQGGASRAVFYGAFVAGNIARAIRARTPSPTPTDRHPYDDGPDADDADA